MDLSKAAYSVVGLVIAVLIVATVAAPIISEAQSQSEPVTLYNESTLYFREAQAGDVLIGTRDSSSGTNVDTWTINGVVISNSTWRSAVFSDGVYVSINSSSNASMGSFCDMADATVTPKYFSTDITITFSSNSVNIAYGSNSYDYAYSWCYVPTVQADGDYYASLQGSSSMVVSSPDDLIYCGAYTTGTTKSTYYGRNGSLTASAGAASATVTTATHDGTKDILDVQSIVITIGSESFTPYYVLAPYEVHGYATSGGNMSLLGVVALLLFIVPVMMAVRMISGRDE